jgi:spore protease
MEGNLFNGGYSFDSDLALERRKASCYVEGVEYKRDVSIGGVWERIKVTSKAGESSIGRPKGMYDTLTLPSMDSIMPEDVEDAKDEIARELCRMCDLNDISPERILVVGLGNRDLTPDAIGPAAALEVEATMHVKDSDPELFESLGCSEICVLCPDVTSNSGMQSADIVKGVVRTVKPTLIIAIDSLASRSSERLGTTVQVSSTGIIPGTGVGHKGACIDEATLGVPVIAVGIPTVISSLSLARENGNHAPGYQKDYFLAPKGINRIVKNGARIIGGGINQAFGMCYF